MRMAIGIATRGRAPILLETLAELDRQHRPADRILVSYAAPGDVAGVAERFPGVEFLTGASGLPAQRNRILDAVADCDAVVFFDDDFLPAPEWLAVLEAVLRARPDCAVATGVVLADGAKGPGIAPDAARAILGGAPPPPDALAVANAFNAYGCNMALRLAPLRAHGIRFDEALPLYAWYEDIDLSRRLLPHGAILRLLAARGVHLGTKQGRVPGVRLGYSQVANPLYLARKGSFPWSHALPSAARHCLVNAVKSLRPEPEVDRRGRLRGNLRALADLLRGRMRPDRVLDL
ncbi:glycosyltransferase family 2 protein [Roseococcus sp. DSY-14]|uniref:glycosyltransferase family 2 protein n=1 Tax=Roseococcus sp. DSY-14 TaxID=3369650 RepID=UPI00387B3C38